MSDQKQTRALPASLAPVVEGLELRQPVVVTKSLLGELAASTAVSLSVDALTERLVRLGWLLPLRGQDAWEFAPAARAGRYSSGDPWIELRAVLAHQPSAPVAVAFESAIWALGHSSHQPSRPVLAHRRGWRPPRALDVGTVTFEWRLPTRIIQHLPVWTEATAIAAVAARPGSQGNWANADDWLPGAFTVVTIEDLVAESRDRNASTLARLGYLADWAGRADLANEIETMLPAQRPVTFLGPREPRDRWSKRWHVYDALLPRR